MSLKEGQVVADGGYLTHYNPPFVDLFMEVQENHRLKGIGSFLLQEIKKECYRLGKIPAARCSINNEASKATLLKAGFSIAGFVIQGKLKSIT
ncbi:MAG: GNAT family N-acetyltransferase [Bacteroidota bacterium]